MFSIFSNYLALLGAKITAETRLNDIYAEMRIIQSRRKCMLDCPKVFLSGIEEEDFDVIYTICTNKDLRNLLNWVNKSIVLNLGIIDNRTILPKLLTTIDVRLRIFTGMLNKIQIQKDISIKIHQNVTSNVKREMSDIVTEDLPF